ncbi:MAG TPA: hypothetical protein VGI67_09040 [Thermoleophilaceae bacterium]
MPPISFQTVRLARGRHESPEEGACVMELASMLAGEPFSDHPHSVCPVLASFLRAYNDGLSEERRQDLFAYAARSVGTAASRRARRLRAQRCLIWFGKEFPSAGPASWLSLLLAGVSLGSVGRIAARAARADARTHRAVLGLLDELVTIGAPVGRPSLNLDQVGAAEGLQPQL